MDINELVPKNKGDISGIVALKALEIEAAIEIMAGLLEWLMDRTGLLLVRCFLCCRGFTGCLCLT